MKKKTTTTKTKEKATKPIEEKNDEKMTEETISDLLIELSNTKFWGAIKIMNHGWSKTVENALKTLDPFKEPTEVARGQGQLLALNFLESFVEGEKKRRNKGEDN